VHVRYGNLLHHQPLPPGHKIGKTQSLLIGIMAQALANRESVIQVTQPECLGGCELVVHRQPPYWEALILANSGQVVKMGFVDRLRIMHWFFLLMKRPRYRPLTGHSQNYSSGQGKLSATHTITSVMEQPACTLHSIF